MGKYFWYRASIRANRETCHFLGVDNIKRLIVSFILFGVSIYVIQLIGGNPQMNDELRWGLAGITATAIFYIPMFIWNLVKAPGRMEKEKDKIHKQELGLLHLKTIEQNGRIAKLEEERIPKFAVKAFPRKPALYERSDFTSLADLEIKNTSTSVDLVDVSVQIVEAVLVLEKREKSGLFFLHEPTDAWTPSNVLWSGITGTPGEYSRPIHPQEKQYATIAHHTGHSGTGAFNTVNQSPVYGNKIVIEVSSSKMNTWKGEFYIEYHPAKRDEFEFEEWDSWCKSHQLIESTLGSGDSQKQ